MMKEREESRHLLFLLSIFSFSIPVFSLMTRSPEPSITSIYTVYKYNWTRLDIGRGRKFRACPFSSLSFFNDSEIIELFWQLFFWLFFYTKIRGCHCMACVETLRGRKIQNQNFQFSTFNYVSSFEEMTRWFGNSDSQFRFQLCLSHRHFEYFFHSIRNCNSDSNSNIPSRGNCNSRQMTSLIKPFERQFRSRIFSDLIVWTIYAFGYIKYFSNFE